MATLKSDWSHWLFKKNVLIYVVLQDKHCFFSQTEGRGTLFLLSSSTF